jgi:ABC-type lipoprotein release transport system permease subunit
MDVESARRYLLDVGSTFSYSMYTPEQWQLVMAGEHYPPPGGPQLDLRIVGLARDVRQGPGGGITPLYAGPAFARRYDVEQGRFISVRLAPGASVDAFVEEARAILRSSAASRGEDPDQLMGVEPAGEVVAGVASVRRLLAGGLVAFCVIAMAAGVVALMQAATRHVARSDADRTTLTGLGMDRRRLVAGMAVPMVVAAAVGVGLGVLGAWLTSPLFPLGAFRALEIDPGLRFDAPTLSLGALGLLLATAGVFVSVAWWAARSRPPGAKRTPGRAPLLRLPPSAGLSTLLGFHLALASGRRRPGASFRPAAVGCALAIATLAAAIGFGGNIDRLREHPSRYGQDFDLQIDLAEADDHGVADEQSALARLDRNPSVRDVTVETRTDVVVSGHQVQAFAYEPRRGHGGPVVLRGRAPRRNDEVVLGPRLARELGLGVGSPLDVDLGGGAGERSLDVVGLGLAADTQANEFDGSVVVTPALMATTDRSLQSKVALVGLAPGRERADIVAGLDRAFPYGITSTSFPAPPAPVGRLAQIRRLPLALGMFLVALAILALTHALVLASRRERPVLAVIRALGASRGQAARSVAVASLATAVTGVVAGVPIGLLATLVIGREVAARLHVVPGTWLPVAATLAAAAASHVVALLVAVPPARAATRPRAVDMLRAE